MPISIGEEASTNVQGAPAARPSDGLGDGLGGSLHDRSKILATLRCSIASIEETLVHRLEPPRAQGLPAQPGDAALRLRHGQSDVLALGLPAADEALAGGFPRRGLTEIHGDDTRTMGAATAFVLALATLFGVSSQRPLLWIGEGFAFAEAGRPYGPGLRAFGFDPAALLLVRTRGLDEAIWAAEEAARAGLAGLGLLEIRGNPAKLSLEGTRRLHVRARESGTAFLILRQSGRPQSTAAPLRLRIRPGPASAVEDLRHVRKLIGPPVVEMLVEKSRTGRQPHILLEWIPHDRRFQTPFVEGDRLSEPDARSVACPSADRPYPARGTRQVLAFRGVS